jgi:hypothetical protein
MTLISHVNRICKWKIWCYNVTTQDFCLYSVAVCPELWRQYLIISQFFLCRKLKRVTRKI